LETLEHAPHALRSGRFTDVFLFSNGWNDDWSAANRRCEHFIDDFIGRVPDDPQRQALLIGIFWPSAVLEKPG
jgi:hypothetical protein